MCAEHSPQLWEWTCVLCDTLVLDLPTINQHFACLALCCLSRKRHSEHSHTNCICGSFWEQCKSKPQDYINSDLPVWNSASRRVKKPSGFLRMRRFLWSHWLCYSVTVSLIKLFHEPLLCGTAEKINLMV